MAYFISFLSPVADAGGASAIEAVRTLLMRAEGEAEIHPPPQAFPVRST